MKKTFLTGSLVGLFLILFLAATVSATPVITANGTSPTDVYTDTDFTFSMTADSTSTLMGYVQFYVNDTPTGSVQSVSMSNDTSTLIGTLGSGNFSKSYTLTVAYWAGDGTDNSTHYNTTVNPVTVQNSVPTISSGTITVNSHEDSDSVVIQASDADGDILDYTVAQGDTSLVECKISGTTLTAERVNNTKPADTTTCTVTVNDNNGGIASEDFTINMNRKSMLQIYDLDVYVDNERDSNLDDGDTIGDKANPESTVKFDFVIKSLFDDNDENEEDIEIEDIIIYVTIKNIDDDGDDDLEEETKEFNLDADEKSSTKSLEFDIPMDVDEDDYEVEIVVEGEDSEYSQEHRVEWTLTLRVDKEKHDMKLKRAEFDQITLSCDRETTFNVKLVNFGSSDEDEIILTIQNAALGINIKEEDLEIDEGDYWSKSYTITVSDDVSPGTYKVVTKMYYDSSDYYDKDFELSAYGSTDLIIKKCVVTTPVEEEEEGDIIIVEPTDDEGQETPTGGEVTREISFQDTSLYLVLLVATVVILGLILLVMVFKLLSK